MDDIKLIIEVEKLITAEVCDIISNARRFGVATASGVTSQAPARQGLALTPRFGVASASANGFEAEQTETPMLAVRCNAKVKFYKEFQDAHSFHHKVHVNGMRQWSRFGSFKLRLPYM
ncbi:unnamed protein product [Pleuronectes platessa]|uniref:Uncharacterized protein n=1 Tax=Pleuronectes platessa TaxID=8262 RepID=A0A9N7Y6T5_PLEPL|nr:unnamed protein product [Pleuronectes platessa]